MQQQNLIGRLTWPLLHRLFLLYELVYKAAFRLTPIDEFLFLKREVYHGPAREFADGTVLEPGDPVGVIHFNNDELARIHAASGNNKSSKRAAFAFAAALVRSMQTLSREMAAVPRFQDLKVISGVTWFRPHGEKVGFEIEPLPEGRQKRILTVHFRILLKAMFPHLAQRESDRLEPHQFWLTRKNLMNFSNPEDAYVNRLVKYNQQSA